VLRPWHFLVGAFLIGAWIGGPILWIGSKVHPPAEKAKPHYQGQPPQTESEHAAAGDAHATPGHAGKNAQKREQESRWYNTFLEHPPDWFVALFTGLLTVVTFLLVRSTNRLWEAGERQISVARDSAQAAKIAAEATKKSVELAQASAAIERSHVAGAGMRNLGPYSSGGLTITPLDEFVIQVANAGKGPAELQRIEWGFSAFGNTLPDEPAYPTSETSADTIHAGDPYRTARIVKIPRDPKDPVIFFRLTYLDIYTHEHGRAGFVMRINPTGQLSVFTDAPAAYTLREFPLK
jgi:hypothetical protein